MTKTTSILFLLLTFSLVSCSSQTEQIENEMTTYIEQSLPTAQHKVTKQGSDYKLTISTTDNISKTELDQIMTTALGEFYKSFSAMSNEASTNSTLSITVVADTNSWTTRKYDLFELGEMYQE